MSDRNLTADNHVRTVTPEAAHPQELAPQVAMQIAIDHLLDDPPPDDWNDPVMRALRTRRLEGIALAAGEAMVELLVRLHDERQRGVHMNEGSAVLA